MIPRKSRSEQTLTWKRQFANSIIGASDFQKEFPHHDLHFDQLRAINQAFQIQLPGKFANHSTAVLRQYLPDAKELQSHPGYCDDPLAESDATVTPGIVKKYPHRVLLITSSICPIHCRYCFRKKYPYPVSNPNTHQFKEAIKYCASDNTIHEVILSGGDPLSLEDELLAFIIARLDEIEHIKTIRIHTKFPSVFPQRVTSFLLSTLSRIKSNSVCVFHINHPDEVSADFCEVAQKIKNSNTVTLNQSVLLCGVNDQAATLIELSHKLFATGVLPYYLHLLDPVTGTRHFLVTEKRGQELIEEMKSRLPGYLVPRLAREIAGHDSKVY